MLWSDSFEEFSALLKIDASDLDGELIRHPEYLFHVSKKAAMALSHQDEARDNIKRAEAEVAAEIRQELQEAGEKTTVKAVEERVTEHPDIVKLQKKRTSVIRSTRQWEALKEAFVARGWALKSLAELEISRGFAEDSKSVVANRVKQERRQQARRKRL